MEPVPLRIIMCIALALIIIGILNLSYPEGSKCPFLQFNDSISWGFTVGGLILGAGTYVIHKYDD